MTMNIASISISARATIDLHNLNNEGGEGNQIQTRMVDVIGADGRMHNVNAISGDMLKHIQAQHFFELAREQGLPLCGGCDHFDANRINADSAWIAQMPKGDRDALASLLEKCAMDDTAGILITAGNRSLPRKSVVEFGWVVGIPTLVKTESYFHVKYVTEREKEKVASDAAAREKEGSNLGQAIFHRPSSSGVYAIVCHLELGRIGYNDISQQYVVDEAGRAQRAKALIQSVMHTFLELNGAMRTTQLPHLVALEGIVTWSSSSAVPAPMVSPLAGGLEGDTYREQVEHIAEALNGKGQPVVTPTRFETLSAFAAEMRGLVDDAVPAVLSVAR
jgi:CRISPR-associated protein Cst2